MNMFRVNAILICLLMSLFFFKNDGFAISDDKFIDNIHLEMVSETSYHLWNIDNGRYIKSDPLTGPTAFRAISENGKKILYTDWYFRERKLIVYVYDSIQMKNIYSFTSKHDHMKNAIISNNGRYISYVTNENIAYTYDLEYDKYISKYHGVRKNYFMGKFIDNSKIMYMLEYGHIAIFDFKNGVEVKKIRFPHLAFHADLNKNFIVASIHNGEVVLLNMNTGHKIFQNKIYENKEYRSFQKAEFISNGNILYTTDEEFAIIDISGETIYIKKHNFDFVGYMSNNSLLYFEKESSSRRKYSKLPLYFISEKFIRVYKNDLDKCLLNNKIELCYEFLDYYKSKTLTKPLFRKYTGAINKLYVLVADHGSLNDAEVFHEKYKQYPEGEKIVSKIFEFVSQKNILKDYQSFIEKYGSYKESKKAISSIFKIIKSENNLAGYRWFSDKFKKSPESKHALKEMYKIGYGIASGLDTIESYNDYIISFPFSKYVKKATDKAYEIEKDEYTGFFSNEEKEARRLLIASKIIEQSINQSATKEQQIWILFSCKSHE